MLEVNIGNTRALCEICSKLSVNTPKWRNWFSTSIYRLGRKIVISFFLIYLKGNKIGQFLQHDQFFQNYLKLWLFSPASFNLQSLLFSRFSWCRKICWVPCFSDQKIIYKQSTYFFYWKHFFNAKIKVEVEPALTCFQSI